MLEGVRIVENRLGIDTKYPRLVGQVSGGLPVPWWYEPPSFVEIGTGSRIQLPEAILRYKGI